MNKTFTVKKGEKKTIIVDRSGEYTIELIGEGAEANIVGIFIGRGNEVFTIHTIQHHKAPNTISDLLIKSVLRDKSKLYYDGLIRIDKKAQKSNAYQRNENLLMSGDAHVESKPELEILANDVRCTHGATMGMVDEEEIFYLMSRGINRKEAEQIIIEGFLQGVLDRIEDKKKKEVIRKKFTTAVV
ncbi:SufD family Fe-S cluster assembly protein [Candidatus Roizmanbacteria bacterium]|nr:SufD family Fe-S cluster assembly protein [Candidatus Roizmanbacteria bacterium]